jgi:signal transduction histidine kinase
MSFRARLTLTIALALVVGVAGFLGVSAILAARAHQALERTLTEQAQSVARAVEREGSQGALRAAQLLPDTRIVVRSGGVVTYWNGTVSDFDASATARSGRTQVTLQRDENPGVAAWVAPLLIVLVVAGLAVLTWVAAGGIARRLRRSAAHLADQAERVARGDLSVRAEVTSDELGRVAHAFNRMTERLDQADQRERAFLADVAHELRTPVTAIDGFAQALADGTAASEEDRAEATAFIRQEATRLRALVGDLRRLTWLELDPPVERSVVDVGALCDRIAGRLEPAAREAGVDLVTPEEHVTAETDPDLVTTILTNLLDNALRHTPRGGRIEVVCRQDRGAALIEVSDTGPGIPPEHLPHVFDRLYRVDPARQRDSGEGSGLGLAIVRRAVTLLGGEISVHNTPGRGATFRVRLPSLISQTPVAHPRPPSPLAR